LRETLYIYIYEGSLIEQLESIYMFLPLPKFSVSPVKEFSGTPKYYIIDNGFNYALFSTNCNVLVKIAISTS